MYSERFNTAVLFNGEIFNHNELRNELELKGVQFLVITQIQRLFC